MYRLFFVAGSLLAGIAVGAGALGAHGLQSALPEWYPDSVRRLEAWDTAVFWMVVHALGLILIAVSPLRRAGRGGPAGILFLLGSLLFSGFLLAWVLLDQSWMVALVPLGGSLWIAGWIALAVAAARSGQALESE